MLLRGLWLFLAAQLAGKLGRLEVHGAEAGGLCCTSEEPERWSLEKAVPVDADPRARGCGAPGDGAAATDPQGGKENPPGSSLPQRSGKPQD